MFTQSVVAPVPAPVPDTLSASPTSPPSRTSRLRGLSYLRNYTQNHILSRDHGLSSSPTNGTFPGLPQPDASARGDATWSAQPSRPVPSASSATSALTSALLSSLSGDSSSADSSRGPHAAAATSSSRPSSNVPAAPVSPVAPTGPAIPGVPVESSPSLNSAPVSSPTLDAPMTRSRSVTEPGQGANASAAAAAAPMDSLPSIRFSAFHDPRAARQSLRFTPMSRTLPSGNEVIRVGRYSERDSQPSPNPSTPSAAHVGFKSKVVSRRHCEFWFENNRWYIKDVKSSSGTFLNHIRLSQPGTESKPFPVNDGDIVQLGIDFKGGEEMIFRCVKMRVELNRGWQNKLNAFNVNTHKRLRNMTKPTGDGSTQSTQDCSICLNSIAPCQSLFVAPCSHTWHYKCIRALLESPQYPSFICPNCRAAVDLEADVEEPPEEWENIDDLDDALEAVAGSGASRPDETIATDTVAAASAPEPSGASGGHAAVPLPHAAAVAVSPPPAAASSDLADLTMRLNLEDGPPEETHKATTSHATSGPVPIPAPNMAAAPTTRPARTPSPGDHPIAPVASHEGPITPRNDAGPWVFDGSGVQVGNGGPGTADSPHAGEMRNLATAAAEMAGAVRGDEAMGHA